MPELTDSCTGEVVEGMEAVEVDVFRGRLARAYQAALTSVHRGARVEIHLGEAVTDYLEGLCTVPDEPGRFPGPRPRMWGFPVVPVANNPAHIAVHVVHDIF